MDDDRKKVANFKLTNYIKQAKNLLNEGKS